MSQPTRTTARTTARTTTRTTTRTATRTGTRSTPRVTTGPVHTPRTGAARRSGPVATGPQLRPVPPSRTTPARTPSGPRRTGRRRAPFVVLLVGMLVATTLGLLLLNTAVAVNSLDASRQRAANAEQAKAVARLEEQVITADTAAQLARAAGAAGLVPPGAAAHLVLQPDGSSELLGTAVPAPDPAAGPAAASSSAAAPTRAPAAAPTPAPAPEPTAPTPGN